MALKFCSFASGSSGNCYMIRNEQTAILIDAGTTGKRIFEGIEYTETPYEDVAAILVTHEHNDHIRNLPMVTKKMMNSQVYANKKTWEAMDSVRVERERRKVFVTGKTFDIGHFSVKPFDVPHDAAEPVGYSLFGEGKQISVLTDVGYITDSIFEEIVEADLLVLEANHEREMLLMGRYPYLTKRRILGEKGHLSNVSAGECLCQIVNTKKKPRQVLLGHMSNENNDPAVAMLAVKNELMGHNIIVGKDLRIDVLLRKCRSCVYEV
ncbi:MAG: MBL fold metallo-hydrolase [Clostridiales bacterium]|nr:MBL fold metallo-hydrolase [Clostridiales bacterium]